MAAFAATLNGVERVEVLPFHQLGANKWAELNLPYQLADGGPGTTPDNADTAAVTARTVSTPCGSLRPSDDRPNRARPICRVRRFPLAQRPVVDHVARVRPPPRIDRRQPRRPRPLRVRQRGLPPAQPDGELDEAGVDGYGLHGQGVR